MPPASRAARAARRTDSCQAAAILKKVRSAGPDSRLRASGSGRTRTSVSGDPPSLRLARISIYGDATPNLDSWEDRPFTPASAWPRPPSRRAPTSREASARSTVETGEGFRTEPAVAKNGTAGARDEGVLARWARRPAGSTAARAAAAAPASAARHRLDLDQLVLEVTDGLGGRRSLRGRSGPSGYPAPLPGQAAGTR